jgi:hypothetical protein
VVLVSNITFGLHAGSDSDIIRTSTFGKLGVFLMKEKVRLLAHVDTPSEAFHDCKAGITGRISKFRVKGVVL